MDNKEESGGNKKRNRLIAVLVGVIVIIIFAYAVQVTQVDLSEPLEPQRQANLVTLIRDLARPDIFEYQTDTRSMNLSIRMPCPEDIKGSQITVEERTVLLVPNCATTTQDPLTISGEGFPSNAKGIVRWYPVGSSTQRVLTQIRADDEGSFETTFTMPDIRETEEPQRIEVVEVLDRRITGLSDTTKETFEKIIETILMALMASTIGTFLAIPISFLGARNLMTEIGAPLAAIMSALIAIPIGGLAGFFITSWLSGIATTMSDNALLILAALILDLALIWILLRVGPQLVSDADEQQPVSTIITKVSRLILVLLMLIFSLALLAQLGLIIGAWLDTHLGLFSFIGNFIFVISDLLRVLLPALVAFLTALVAASYASHYGQEAILRIAEQPARLLTALLTTIGTTVLVFGIAYFINWICLLGICERIPQEMPAKLLAMGIPALIVGIVAGILSLLAKPKRLYPVGIVVYSITRTILNGLRAIEPVILGFVLVVWVGIGPFAGILALMLHSIADLGKLFSEQVENVSEGPLEAVTATGASRLQLVAFAVIPQIVPQYTAFIFYRWDINVRLSTIIGFVGGGGIGLILFRSTNLTQYRQASVMIIAIAIVITTLDYISSKIRKRII